MGVHIPQKAIVHASCKEEATLFLEFMRDNGYTFGSDEIRIPEDVRWYDHDGGSCYNIERGNRILYSDRKYYATEVARFLSYENPEDIPWDLAYYIPEDPAWRFISVPDFIAKCSGIDVSADEELNADMDLSVLL